MRLQVATTNGPIVMLGTKCPSITSTWIQSAPAASTVAISSPRRAKSAERIDGERIYLFINEGYTGRKYRSKKAPDRRRRSGLKDQALLRSSQYLAHSSPVLEATRLSPAQELHARQQEKRQRSGAFQ